MDKKIYLFSQTLNNNLLGSSIKLAIFFKNVAASLPSIIL